jgi:neutral ceramidase
MKNRFLLLAAALLPLFVSVPSSHAAPALRVGVARADITPEYPVRLSGYGNRRAEHEGVAQRIWAKALAFDDGAGRPAVLVTVDNCGVPATLRAEALRRVAARTNLADARFAVCSSHTHCAPMLTGVLPNLFSMDIPPEHLLNIERYTRELTDHLERVTLAALADLRPAQLAWGVGHVGFAHNRRQFNFRPEDHSLPVLRVNGADGKPRALLTSYACHCTTISSNFVHGDWAGVAQAQIERDFPGAIALTAIGCGADQNPQPRQTMELVEQYGRDLAAEVKRLAGGKLTPVSGALECRAKEIRLPFDTLPTRAEWEERAKSPGANIAYHAKKNLARLDRGEKLPTHLPYLVQTWNFGTNLALVFLPGEVTVDYSLRLKLEFDAARLWVNAYANDVPCYIPSERVLAEGGYEGASAMVYYDRPTHFAPGVEGRIIGTVRELMPRQFRRPGGR